MTSLGNEEKLSVNDSTVSFNVWTSIIWKLLFLLFDNVTHECTTDTTYNGIFQKGDWNSLPVSALWSKHNVSRKTKKMSCIGQYLWNPNKQYASRFLTGEPIQWANIEFLFHSASGGWRLHITCWKSTVLILQEDVIDVCKVCV